MAAKFNTENTYQKLTFDEVVEFLEANGTAEEKKAFKKACFTNKDGKTVKKLNWLNGKKWFCENFAKELIPVAKPKEELKSKKIMNW
jgi:hypothetical protein